MPRAALIKCVAMQRYTMRAGPQAPEYAVQHTPVINTRHTTRLVRQYRVGSRTTRNQSGQNAPCQNSSCLES